MQGTAVSISCEASDNRHTKLTSPGTSIIITMEACAWTSRLQCASLDCMAKEWDLTQVRRSTELGHCPKWVTGALPKEYMILAIGVKNDHIFQGIIYGQPRHPLMLRAINHAFSKSILSKVASLECMIFCKGTLAALGHRPWPCSPGGVESEQALWPDLSPSGTATPWTSRKPRSSTTTAITLKPRAA